jgi:colanic acid biosynthesis protein WcaH
LLASQFSSSDGIGAAIFRFDKCSYVLRLMNVKKGGGLLGDDKGAYQLPKGLIVLASETFKTVVESTPLVSIDLCLVFERRLLMGLRQNEPLKGQSFTPGGRLLKNERWQDGLARIAKTELGLTVTSDDFELMGVWDHFYENSAIGEGVSTHYVNLPHVCFLESRPVLSLDA